MLVCRTVLTQHRDNHATMVKRAYEMKVLKPASVLMVIMGFFLTGTGRAEEKGKAVYMLDEIVVTATKTEKNNG